MDRNNQHTPRDVTENTSSLPSTNCIYLKFSSISKMARTANLSSVIEAFSVIPKLHLVENIRKKATFVNFLSKKTDELQENTLQTTRRLALGLASLAIFSTASTGISLAEDNGYWLTGPIPVPSAKNSELFTYHLL